MAENQYTQIWICHNCSFEYEDKYDARNCCAPETFFKCSVCGFNAADENGAINHFENEHYSYFEEVRQIELEKAGQKRLFS